MKISTILFLVSLVTTALKAAPLEIDDLPVEIDNIPIYFTTQLPRTTTIQNNNTTQNNNSTWNNNTLIPATWNNDNLIPGSDISCINITIPPCQVTKNNFDHMIIFINIILVIQVLHAGAFIGFTCSFVYLLKIAKEEENEDYNTIRLNTMKEQSNTPQQNDPTFDIDPSQVNLN